MEINARGRVLLKVVGILYIIFDAIGLLSTVVTLTPAGQNLLNMAGVQYSPLYYIISIILSVFGIIVGITAVKNSDKPENANICIVMSIILILLRIVDFVVTFNNVSSGTSLVSLIIGLILPVLLLIGGVLNKKSQIEA
jgi:hypothetical protein